MELLINLLIAAIVVLAIANFVVRMALMDRAYAARVRSEYETKSYLRGERPNSRWDDR